MFLNSITLVRTMPCLAEPGKIIVVGKPSRPFDEVLPYLASLPNVIAHNPETGTLTFHRQPGFLSLYPDKVYITQVGNAEQGIELLAALADAINTTWEHRDRLKAVTVQRRALRPFDVWALLPQTNCKQCGEATCMAFAFALLLGKQTVTGCVPFQDDSTLADRWEALESLL